MNVWGDGMSAPAGGRSSTIEAPFDFLAALSELALAALRGDSEAEAAAHAVQSLAGRFQTEAACWLTSPSGALQLAAASAVGWRPEPISSLDLPVGDELAVADPGRLLQGLPADADAVAIPGREGSLGALALRRPIGAENGRFLMPFAAVLGSAIERIREQAARREMQERLNMAQAGSSMGVWEWDIPSGRVNWSESLEVLHGLAPGTFEGTFEGWKRDIHPDDLERVLAATEASLQTGHHEVQYRIVTPGSLVRWIAARGIMVRDGQGTPVKGVGICMDVTDQHIAEESLRASEERLRLAQEAANVGTWEVDGTTGETCWSQASERIFGLEPGTFAGTIEASLAQVHPDDLPRLRLAMSDLEERGESTLEFRIRRPDGPERWVETYARIVGDRRVVGVHLDVTERHRSEASLRESEVRFRDVANAVPTLIWMTDASGRCSFLNEQWAQYTGWSIDEGGGDIWSIVHPQDREQFENLYASSVAELKAFELEFRLHRGNGDYCWFLNQGKPRFDASGSFAGFIGSCIDITERRRGTMAMKLLADISSELAVSLDPRETLSALAATVVPRFADWCAASLLESDGTLSRAALRHRTAAGEALLARLESFRGRRVEGPEVTARVIATGQPMFVPRVAPEDIEAWARDPDHQDVLEGLNMASGLCVPLIARGHTLGALSFSRMSSSDPYDEQDFELALEIGRRTALAVDNAGLYRESQEREAGMRRANDALQFLADAGVELTSSLDYQETLAKLARLAVPKFADVSFVDIALPDGSLTRFGLGAATPALEEHAGGLRLRILGSGPAAMAMVQRLKDGRSIFVPDLSRVQFVDYARDDQHLEDLLGLEMRSLIIVPMVARNTVLGALAFIRTRTDDAYTIDDLAVAEQLGRRAGLSLDNSRLYDEARHIEADLRRTNELIGFVADAGAELSKSLDYEESLAKLAELAVPRFADWCAIDVMEGEEFKRVTVVHRDPGMVQFAAEFARRYPAAPAQSPTVREILATGKSVLYHEIPDDLLQQAAVDDEHLRLMRRFGFKSAMAVALSSRGRTFGIMTFVSSVSAYRYDEDDLAIAEELARSAGVAIDNARLFTESQRREQELRRVNEAKDEFLGLMSHELRTPITVIHGGTRVLRSHLARLDDETRDGMLGDIERESERLARMLENLLTLARAELDQEPTVEPVLVQRVVARCVEGSNRLSPGRVVKVSAERDMPPVAAESAYLEHVVRNLISNADKYSPPDRPIEVSISHEDEAVIVRVLDRGFGVAADEIERIFERFYRSDRTSKIAGGAGMGLAVCKRLIEAMGGQIWARPREGGGLEVGFSLPLYEEEQE